MTADLCQSCVEARLGPFASAPRSGTVAAAFDEGRRWSIERAIAYALEFVEARGELPTPDCTSAWTM